MPVDVTMPKLSDTMEEGKILRWLKHPGDHVAIGEIIAEVETDKANMELEAYDEGTLAEVRVQEGESAPVGAVIAVLAAPGEGAGAKPAAKTATARPEAPRESPRPTVVRRAEPPAPRAAAAPVKASPLARRIARDHDLDLARVSGTGPGGRVVQKDVEAAIAGRGGAAPAAAKAVPAETRPAAGTRVELSRIRRTTARRMGEAKREIPHFYASAEIAMDDAARLKDMLTALAGEYTGLTYTHIILKAVGLALTRVPELNASYDGEAMMLHQGVNVGVATAVDDGLVVPVVRNCDREPLAAIVRQARGLLERARAGRFGAEDLTGGTFTLSNLGMLPVTEFAAVINPPQAAILAVGAIRETAVVREGQVVPGRMMTVTISCDHRIIDGVLAGRFLRELKALLENPLALVL